MLYTYACTCTCASLKVAIAATAQPRCSQCAQLLDASLSTCTAEYRQADMQTRAGLHSKSHQQQHKQRVQVRFAWMLLLATTALHSAAPMSAACMSEETHAARPHMTDSKADAAAAIAGALPRQLLQGDQLPTSAATARVTLQRYFAQFSEQCGGESWKLGYQRLHHNIVTGKFPPYYVTSLAVEKGLADRITGLVTQFYLALLSKRAFTMVTYGWLPAFEAVCDMPYINWTNPFQYPDAVLDPLKWGYHGIDPESPDNRTYPSEGLVNSSTYYPLYLINQSPKDKDCKLCHLSESNLSLYPADNPSIPYVVSANNRGQTYRMMHNPYHKEALWKQGLTPATAFMCGFFYLCAPNAAVQASKLQYWEALQRPNTLRIAISVRVGDRMFRRDPRLSATSKGMHLLHKRFLAYFRCAAQVEAAFAAPDQQVIWYLMSDSIALRKAAKEKYGSKLLTDINTHVRHVDCNKSGTCGELFTDQEQAMQHAFGEMLTFSMADYHIYTAKSGFGRLGAWLSGKLNNMYQLNKNDTSCEPHAPTAPHVSASTWSRV